MTDLFLTKIHLPVFVLDCTLRYVPTMDECNNLATIRNLSDISTLILNLIRRSHSVCLHLLSHVSKVASLPSTVLCSRFRLPIARNVFSCYSIPTQVIRNLSKYDSSRPRNIRTRGRSYFIHRTSFHASGNGHPLTQKSS